MKQEKGLPVLDSHALLAFLEDESGADEVEEVLRSAGREGLEAPLCVVNWGEILYITERERGSHVKEDVVAALDQLPIALIDADRELTMRAAEVKANHSLSYADAFCCALAELLEAPLLTGDPEFRSVEERVDVRWLG